MQNGKIKSIVIAILTLYLIVFIINENMVQFEKIDALKLAAEEGDGNEFGKLVRLDELEEIQKVIAEYINWCNTVSSELDMESVQ